MKIQILKEFNFKTFFQEMFLPDYSCHQQDCPLNDYHIKGNYGKYQIMSK